MTSRNTNRLETLIAATATLFALAIGGCATGSLGATQRPADVRGKAAIASANSHAIAQGPGRLLHVDVEAGSGVSLYTVMAKPDGSIDCGAGARVGETARLHRDSNVVNIDLAAGQIVCVAVDGGTTRRANVAWHARQQPAAVSHAMTLARR